MRRWCAWSAVASVVVAGGLERRLEHGGDGDGSGLRGAARVVAVAVPVAVAVAVAVAGGDGLGLHHERGTRGRRRRRGALPQPLERLGPERQHRPLRRERDAQLVVLTAPAAASQSMIPGVAAAMQDAEVDVEPVHREQAGQVVELGHARAPRHVGGHRAGRLPAQDVLDEGRHVPARPGLHEDPRAVRVQRLDRLAEAHRARPVLDEQLADLLRVLGVARRGRARPERAGGRAHRELGEDPAQVLGEGREERRVHRAVVREDLADQPLPRGDPARPRGGRGLAHEDGLVRAVVHRQVQLAAGLVRDRPHLLGARADRQQHGARHVVTRRRVGVGAVQAAAERAQPLVGLEVERAAEHRRGVLPRAVAHHRVDARQQPAHDRVERGAGREDRLDGDVELHQLRPVALALVVGEGGPREHPVAEHVAAGVAVVEPVDPVEDGARLVEVQAEVGEHPGVLRALAGEDDHDLALGAERLGRVVDARDRLDPPAPGLAQLRDGLLELGAQVGDRGGDDRQALRATGGAQRGGERGGDVEQRDLRGGVEPRRSAPRPRRPARGAEPASSRHSSVSHGGRWSVAGGPSNSSSTACALMPPNPKAFTPARRGSSPPWIHGRVSVLR